MGNHVLGYRQCDHQHLTPLKRVGELQGSCASGACRVIPSSTPHLLPSHLLPQPQQPGCCRPFWHLMEAGNILRAAEGRAGRLGQCRELVMCS